MSEAQQSPGKKSPGLTGLPLKCPPTALRRWPVQQVLCGAERLAAEHFRVQRGSRVMMR